MTSFISNLSETSEDFDFNEPFGFDHRANRTRLHVAVSENHIGVVRGLLCENSFAVSENQNTGVNIGALDTSGYSALLYSVRDDRREISRMILRLIRW